MAPEFDIREDENRLRERLLLDPRDDASMLALAGIVEGKGDLPQAIDLCQRALRVDPYRLDALLGLARLWAALGESDRARPWLERALAVDPDCAQARAALGRLAMGTEPTEAYIRTLFDQYAPRFDAELTRTLNYRAPSLVAEALAPHLADRADILDLGCGTGLSGAALKPMARRLDGVDLSSGMVARARERVIYDALAVGEARAFLANADRVWDVIAAVDMLNYVGDLAPIFATAATRLHPGGLFAGTVELGKERGVVLTPKRRYAHGREHLAEAAARADLEIIDLAEDTLRTEGGVPVAGLVFVIRKA